MLLIKLNEDVNQGAGDIVSKSFCPSRLRCDPGVFKLKLGQQYFQMSTVFRLENSGIVCVPDIRLAKVARFKTKICFISVDVAREM